MAEENEKARLYMYGIMYRQVHDEEHDVPQTSPKEEVSDVNIMVHEVNIGGNIPCIADQGRKALIQNLSLLKMQKSASNISAINRSRIVGIDGKTTALW